MSPRRKANSTANDIATVTPIHQDAPGFPEETPEPSFVVPDPPPAPEQLPGFKPRQPAQRRVSAEVVKAETRLLSLERRRQESLAHHDKVWADKRTTLLLGLPADVHTALVAMGVLVEDEDLAEPGE